MLKREKALLLDANAMPLEVEGLLLHVEAVLLQTEAMPLQLGTKKTPRQSLAAEFFPSSDGTNYNYNHLILLPFSIAKVMSKHRLYGINSGQIG